jgi:hypothetical protein
VYRERECKHSLATRAALLWLEERSRLEWERAAAEAALDQQQQEYPFWFFATSPLRSITMNHDEPIPFVPAEKPNSGPLVRESIRYLASKKRRDIRQFVASVRRADEREYDRRRRKAA